MAFRFSQNINSLKHSEFKDENGVHVVKKLLYGAGTGDAGLFWEASVGPTIQSFTANPSSIDLDNRPSGTITFNFVVLGTAGQSTVAQIVRLPDGGNIGASFTGGAGLDLRNSLPNIAQPNRPTTYRLFARNDNGQTSRDVSIDVTKNPVITNLRRTGYIDATTLYEFGFTVQGLPRPTVTYAFSGGQQGTVNSIHFRQGANPYTWNVSQWRINFANANAQSLVLTATNSSGSVTARLGNIND